MVDPRLDVISEDLRAHHGRHTVILYGSRARGDATATSDYDVLGVEESGDSVRDARLWNGVYLDIFIHPEAKLLTPDASRVYIKDGIVLFQKGDLGSRFLERLHAIDAAGPKQLPADEIRALVIAACSAGVCGTSCLPAGTPLAAQKAGDCISKETRDLSIDAAV